MSKPKYKEDKAYWIAVTFFLVKIFFLSTAEAQAKVAEYKIFIREEVGNIIYHEDPYRVACGILGESESSEGYAIYWEHFDRMWIVGERKVMEEMMEELYYH